MNSSLRCNSSMEIIEPSFEAGVLYNKKVEGATSEQQCMCREGTYLLNGVCMGCPNGALCNGGALPPIAAVGFGQLEPVNRSVKGQHVRETNGTTHAAAIHQFYACNGKERCPGSSCDCIGGKVVSTDQVASMRCGTGYVDSPLCAQCDQEADYAMSLGVCTKCSMPSMLYFFISAIVSLLWFPIFALVAEQVESAEIIVSVLQFLGLYSNFAIEWPSMMQSLFNNLSFFNLDLEMLLLRCWNHLDYFTAWWIQVPSTC